MKLFKSVIIPLSLCFFLTSCKSAEQTPAGTESAAPAQTAEAGKTEVQASSADISEKAMNNFLNKVDQGNYTINDGKFLKTSVYSNDQVYFEFTEDMYEDFAVVSVNNETFQGFIENGGLNDISYIGEGCAVDAAKPRLLNNWMDESVSQGNIYNLFYNSPEEPLTFVSYEDAVKRSLLSFTGYGTNALRLMHEVYMVLDNEDPSVVHLKAEMDEDQVARIFLDDIDVTVSFGEAAASPEAEAWMNNPVYPAGRSGWTDTDIFIFNSVFLPGYGEAAVPFTPFASYALTIDDENFVMDDEVSIRDSHATAEDMENYIELLKHEGFSEVKETNQDGTGKTYYRRILREDYKCYSSIELDYDNGINMKARKYYDFPVYEGLDKVNEVIVPLGFTALPESGSVRSVKATDTACEATESWLYFFDYDSVLYVDVDFEDGGKMSDYLKDYEEALVNAGFRPVYVDETEIDRYESENGFSSFRYLPDEDKATLLFKSERYISADEAEALIKDGGFPEMELTDNISCRDLKKFASAQYGLDYKAYLTLSKFFETAAEAEEFLGSYESRLNDAGFDRTSPAVAGTNRQIAIYNEERDMVVGVDFTEQNGGALVNLEFKAR